MVNKKIEAEFFDLFSVPFLQANIDIDNLPITSFCLDQQKNNPMGRRKSNIGGWQSNCLESLPDCLEELFDIIKKISYEFSDSISVPISRIDNIWININGYKDSNTLHTHPKCIMSGVYYVKCPENSGDISFRHPLMDVLQYDWGHVSDKFNKFNSSTRHFTPQSGMLYIFPSWIAHYVNPNLNQDEERISISFNIS